MVTDTRLSVCNGVRNRRDLNLVVECIECRVKIWIVINAVFEFLPDDWDRTDSREVSNYLQLIEVGEIREDSRVQDARVRWNIVTCHLARDSSSDESSSPNSSSRVASTS